MTTCPCWMHRATVSPETTYKPMAGLIDLLDLCRCECDHEPDEQRWAA